MKRLLPIAAIVLVAVVVFAAFLFRPHRVEKISIKKLDPWILQTNDPKALIGFNDALYGTYLGNGYIGARIGPEGVGSYKGQPLPCLMAGLYEGESLKALPNWSDFPLYDYRLLNGNRRLTLDIDAPYRQTLNLREGYVKTELTIKSGMQRLTGTVVFFIMRPEASRALGLDANIAVVRYEMVSRINGKVDFQPGPSNLGGWSRSGSEMKGSNWLFGCTLPGHDVIIDAVTADGSDKSLGIAVDAKRGQKFVLTKYVAVSDNSVKDAEVSEEARKIGFSKLFSAHKQAWRDIWKSDIVIEGDPAAQQSVHAMMFYLLCSASPNNSIPPNGVSGGAWAGHVFWDADTWMFPALLLQHPDEASGIVRYRLKTRSGAEQNATKRGLQGLEVAWESARTGLEAAPHPYSEERHITADAAIAASNDPGRWTIMMIEGSLRNPHSTFELSPTSDYLRNTATYWASLAVYNKVKDRYEILNVVPPDEDAEIVNNSVYTNAAAKRNIELAVEIAKKNGQKYPAKWDDIVKKIFIPFDAKNRRFLEYDGYNGKKTKQADTELLIYPLAYPMPDDVKRNTFDFYKTKTDPRGPAMTSSIHAIIAAELGRPDEAYKHFIDSYQPFMRGPMLMFNEKRSKTYDNICFLTGCGGSLQSVIYGFGGLRVRRAPEGFNQLLPGLWIKPCLPPNWKKLQITDIQWRGKRYNLTIRPGNKWELEEIGNRKTGPGG